VIEGVEMTKSALAAALASEGVEEIPADGVFDPHVHEALLTQPAEGVEPGVIVQVVQRGYRLGDVVLRPARVIVAE
jgi:molecular chaperone GrpE